MTRAAVLGVLTAVSAEAGQGGLLHVRLRTSLSTFRASDGQPLIAEVTRPLVKDDAVIVPTHSLVYGEVVRANSVGLGIRRERASVEVAFTQWRAPQGGVRPLNATLLAIDNAREQVDRRGRIQGILAANNPLGVVRGVWYKPSPQLLLRPAGIAGTRGTILSRIALGPTGSAALLGARLLLTKLPEPEIDLPPGTELILSVDLPGDAASHDEPGPSGSLDEESLSRFQQQPRDIRKPNGPPVTDLINLAFVASGDSIHAAFLAAGWSEAEPLTRKSFGEAYKAFTERSGYASAPVSMLLYQDRPPDLVFQKSLNSIAKRHHIRLWRLHEYPEETWVAAASHDVTVTFDRRTFGLSHRVDPYLDDEREKVIADLDFVGALWDRVSVSRTSQVTLAAKTDGVLAVLRLQEPSAVEELPANQRPDPRAIRRLTRRTVLEVRQYMLRENIYYLSYLTARGAIARRRSR